MEIVFTKRYKINLIFSVVISSLTASVISFAVPYIITDLYLKYNETQGIIAVITFLTLHLFITRRYRRRKHIARIPFPVSSREILDDMVLFYKMLNAEDKYYFEKRVQIFLSEKKITGIDTDIDTKTKLLVASAAIIPVFKIDDWEYDKLGEILVYPDRFDDDYNFKTGERDILGMVVHNTSSLIISKKELFKGFKNMGRYNTAIHEFIHKIDEEDGEIDGLPVMMLNREELTEWKKIREIEIKKLKSGKSDLDWDDIQDSEEFLAVAGEYFFNNPNKMKEKNPELYKILKKIFKQDMAALIKSEARTIFRKK
jgi:Mlc titration factor MtfA (ptsG expression regulator)